MFETVAQQDQEFADDEDFEAPGFGDSQSSYEEVCLPFNNVFSNCENNYNTYIITISSQRILRCFSKKKLKNIPVYRQLGRTISPLALSPTKICLDNTNFHSNYVHIINNFNEICPDSSNIYI